jgi:hypothetical protein
VAHEAVKREETSAEPGDPEPDRERTHAVLLGDGGHALTAQRRAHRREHHVGARHLAGQGIGGQHPLAMPTRAAAG